MRTKLIFLLIFMCFASIVFADFSSFSLHYEFRQLIYENRTESISAAGMSFGLISMISWPLGFEMSGSFGLDINSFGNSDINIVYSLFAGPSLVLTLDTGSYITASAGIRGSGTTGNSVLLIFGAGLDIQYLFSLNEQQTFFVHAGIRSGIDFWDPLDSFMFDKFNFSYSIVPCVGFSFQ